MDSVKWASPQANAHFTQSVYELCNRMSHRFSPIDTLKHFLRNKLGGYIVAIKDIRTNNLLYRGVSCPERPSTIDRVSYPPADKITKLGLVNRIGTSMFYCSAAGRDMAMTFWSRKRKSSRTSRCGRRAIGRTASSPVRISTGTGNAEPTSAPAGNCCRPAAPCMTDVRCCTAHQSGTAIYARYERSAAPRPMRARSPRDLHEDARDIARRKMKTKAFAKSRDERKRVEMRFAHLKTHHG